MTSTRGELPSTAPSVPFDPERAERAKRALELDLEYVFHSWLAQDGRQPFTPDGAQGSWLWDGAGTPYLDFSGQLVFTNIGFSEPRVAQAIADQAARLATVAPQHANDARSEAARLIVERAPGEEFRKVFFTNGGADAIENAVRMARVHTGRRKVLSRYRSYHGNTTTAINLTGDPRRWANDYGSEGIVHTFGPFLYRSAFHASTEEEECARALEHLEQVVALEGPSTIAAIVLESIPGTAGIMVPPAGYLRGVREICDKHGILWIADEVMSGFGRAGRWFACELANEAPTGAPGEWKPNLGRQVTPDLITFAKGVNSGYVPLGGVLISERIAATFGQRPFPGGLTYSGHPLACAAAVANIGVIEDDSLIANADRLGREVVGPELHRLAESSPIVGEVRGLGAFWAVELVRDKETREPLVPAGASGAANAPMAALAKACMSRGLIPFINGSRTHVVPALNITDEEARYGLGLLTEALAEVSQTL
ncbi:aspartate aminotransferase family protein [Kineosporia babensis]|uniref:Aspartate aminotransferase family protein n=1 Tax=Kineosporia babensis TaxID=499548 RepID=A0A9X1N9E0_9ACTN|nr:aspartate aminotransferase family protein [Kineosporia babensis]MCD5309689.1 aspartate aminotransferase family protein [Kineosporia babensis]